MCVCVPFHNVRFHDRHAIHIYSSMKSRLTQSIFSKPAYRVGNNTYLVAYKLPDPLPKNIFHLVNLCFNKGFGFLGFG